MKKTLTTLALAAALVALPYMTTVAQDEQQSGDASGTKSELSEKQMALIKENVLANLKHESLEVRAGAIQLLIDMKEQWPEYNMNYAVVPMMETLKSDPKPEFRILAALALFHLDSELGRFAVERRAKFDDNARVAKHCASLARNWDKKTQPEDLVAEVKRIAQ